MSYLLQEACRTALRNVGLLRENAPVLLRFWERAERLEVPDGTVLIREGSPGDSLLFVVEGSLFVSIRGDDGEPIQVVTLSSPLLLGATGAVDGELRTSTCTTQGSVTVLRMRRGVFLDAVRQSTPEAELMRELLLINMHRQLLAATGRLNGVLKDA